ncbi:hypothetical protein O3P69_003493 [Scylla paramamosain]|uniref:Immunoglobulin I-set domain-containing protein n=1 Tax=Scylla paramamosain TaxID=85552 RepID=A0AAW0ULD7_SCYPA
MEVTEMNFFLLSSGSHSVSGRSGVTEYTITSVSKADEGIYLCSAENSAGTTDEFMCSGEGPESDQLEFSFRRSDNRPLPQGSRTHQGTLYLTVVDESASGEYACVGRDRISGSILFTIYTTIEVLDIF